MSVAQRTVYEQVSRHAAWRELWEYFMEPWDPDAYSLPRAGCAWPAPTAWKDALDCCNLVCVRMNRDFQTVAGALLLQLTVNTMTSHMRMGFARVECL